MRNRTIQSVLARRHMFNNGGMVSPPEQATGILASSPSLVDAVSNDALSDMGGGTLSMAQGGAAVNMQPNYVFNQGGIAKFRHGGPHFSDNEIVAKVLNQTATEAERNAVKQSSYGKREDVARAIRLAEGTELGGPIPLRPGVNVADYQAAQRKEKMGTLTKEDRQIPSPFNKKPPSVEVAQMVNMTSNQMRQMGFSESEIGRMKEIRSQLNKKPPSVEVAQTVNMTSEQMRQMGFPESEIRRMKEIRSLPISVFKQPAIDINAPSPGEEAIVNIAESALTRPVPQVEKPNIGGPVSQPGDASIKEVSEEVLPAPAPSADEIAYDQLSKRIETMPFAPEVETRPETPPPPGGTDPREKVEVEKLVDKPIVNANLMDQGPMPGDLYEGSEEMNFADATSKKSNNVVTALANAQADYDMGGEGGSVGADGQMVTGDELTITNDNGEQVTVSNDIVASATNQNKSNTNEDITISLSDDIIRMGKNAEDGEAPNMNTLRKRIEALIPAVEDDPQTEGLLLALLGASIAGGESPNALKNVSDGMQKALPGLINFGAKQKAARRARQTEIAKLVIGEELKLAAEGRTEKREIAREGRVGEHYILTKPAMIRGQKVGAYIPRYLTKTEVQDLQKLNPEIALFPLKYVKKLDTQAGSGKMSLEDLNRLVGPAKPLGEAPFENYQSNFQPTVFFPKGAAMLRAGKDGSKISMTMSANAWKAWEKEYFRVSGNYGKIHRRIAELEKMDINKLVGVNVIEGKFGDLLAGVSKGIPGEKTRDTLATWSRSLLSGQKLSELAKAENRGRLILARITPLILGESGKTISDADRIRVAKTLGFEVDTGTDAKGNETFLGIKGIRKNIFQNPEQIRDALKGVRELMAEKYADIHKIHSAFAQRVGREIKPLQGTKENPLKADLTK